jgi:hypothetical protein
MLPVGRPRPIPVYFVLRVSPHTGGMTIHPVLHKAEQVSAFFSHELDPLEEGNYWEPTLSVIELPTKGIGDGDWAS